MGWRKQQDASLRARGAVECPNQNAVDGMELDD